MKLGRYEVVRELGKGAMGIVYLAKDPLIGRLVALKTIRPAAHADDDETKEFQQRFLREAQAAGILNHPSIVTVHDIGQDETSGVMFIAMEYVEGSNMKEVLSQGRPLTFEQTGEIIAQVGDALDFAHSKGIVHRDVKPANIILLEGMRAKITDFGIAKIASGVSNLTSTGQFLGTPNYMAPEQIKGAPVDGRTDIFALGICLYECLTRRKPFGGDSLTSISYKIVHEPFPPLAEINPQIPEGYEDVIARCLAKDPAKRYQRARDMASMLRGVIRGERPVHTEPVIAEETMVTRHDKIPTMEMPFPEAAMEEIGTNPAGGAAAVSATGATSAKPATQRKMSIPRPPVADVLKKTLTNVRAMPLWRRRIPIPVFAGIIGLFVVGLLISVAAIRAKAPAARPIDAKAEAQRKRERQLRLEGNELMQQGRLTEASAKWQELAKIAPHSPMVLKVLQQLGSIRQAEELSRQQIALAKEKFEQGRALYSEKKYAEAIPLLEESFHINPNSDETATYLKLAQDDQQRAIDEKSALAKQKQLAKQAAATTTHAPVITTMTPHTTAGGDGGHPVVNNAGAPAHVITYFKSPFADGTITVKIGSKVILQEPVWEETKRFFRRVKAGRTVSMATEIAPVNADMEVWVDVPSLGIKEYKVLPRINFQPGSTHRLIVTADATTKKFDYSIN